MKRMVVAPVISLSFLLDKYGGDHSAEMDLHNKDLSCVSRAVPAVLDTLAISFAGI